MRFTKNTDISTAQVLLIHRVIFALSSLLLYGKKVTVIEEEFPLKHP